MRILLLIYFLPSRIGRRNFLHLSTNLRRQEFDTTYLQVLSCFGMNDGSPLYFAHLPMIPWSTPCSTFKSVDVVNIELNVI